MNSKYLNPSKPVGGSSSFGNKNLQQRAVISVSYYDITQMLQQRGAGFQLKMPSQSEALTGLSQREFRMAWSSLLRTQSSILSMDNTSVPSPVLDFVIDDKQAQRGSVTFPRSQSYKSQKSPIFSKDKCFVARYSAVKPILVFYHRSFRGGYITFNHTNVNSKSSCILH